MYARRAAAKVAAMKTTSLAAALAAALVLAAPAGAATTGSTLSRDATTTLGCPGACTLAWGAEGWFDAQIPEGEIVTSWTADLAPSTTARLRLVRPDGESTTALGASEVVTGSAAGGVQTFRTHLPAPGRGVRVAIELQSGAIGAVADDSYGVKRFEPALAEGETRAGTRTAHELRLQVTSEGDADADGRGDATEDDCVFQCPAAPAPAPAPPASDGPGGGAPTPTPTPPAGRPLTVDTRAVLRDPRRGILDVYVTNESAKDLDATLAVLAGGRRVGGASVKGLEAGDHTVVAVKVAKAALGRKLRLTGRATLVTGATDEIDQPLAVIRGGDRRYDGTWRGAGPFVLVVERGLVRTVNATVMGFCPDSSEQLRMNVFTANGAPAVVGRDGSFKLERGRAVSQENTYRGKLSLKGSGKGYASAFRVRMTMSGGRFVLEGCTGATNFAVKRVTR